MTQNTRSRFKTILLGFGLFFILMIAVLLALVVVSESEEGLSLLNGFNFIDRLVVFRLMVYGAIVLAWPFIARFITRRTVDEVQREQDYLMIKNKQWHVAVVLLLVELIIIQQLGL